YLCDHLSDEVEEVNAKLSQFIFNYVKRGRNTVVPPAIRDWESEEQEELQEQSEESVDTTVDAIETLIAALIDLLNKLPPTLTEITKKDLFDRLKIRQGRTEKLVHVKEIIATHRPELVLRERRDRVVKKAVKYL
ncbi:MAG: hypothetical protein ACRDAQ_06315, partial [Cetobacterium sp.]